MSEEDKYYEPLMRVEEVLPILDRISIFGGLNETQLYKIFKRLKLVHYDAGERIFSQGDQPSYIYIVLRGRVRLVFDVAEHPLSKAQFGPGECFGETSVIGIQAHSASTRTEEATDLLVLSKESLMSIFDEDKELFGMLVLNIAREASRRLHRTDELLLHYIHHTEEN